MSRDSYIRLLAITLILGCVATVTYQVRSNLARLEASREAESDYAVGQTLDFPQLTYSKTDFTLFVFGRHNCSACAASLVGLRELNATLATQGIRSIYVSRVPQHDEELHFARQAGIIEADIVEWPDAARVSKVPTIVLANKQGRVLWTRLGIVSEADATELGNALRETTREVSARQ